MKNKYIKYGILLFLGFLTIKKNIHFGDYCTGMPDGIQWLFFCFIFIIAVIILIRIKENKYDPKIYWIVLITIVLNFTIKPAIEVISNKKLFLVGTIDNIGRNKQISLNDNNSFNIELQEVEWTCYKKGKYEIKENILILKKDNLIQETDSFFTYKYKIDLKKKILIPLERGFNTITIK